MGGSAFASKNLITPRIPPELYDKVLRQLVLILQRYFAHVDSALEGPGKKDYGDIDILVAEPLDYENGLRPTAKELAAWIGAPHWRSTSGSDTFNFALPWPESPPQSVREEDEDREADSSSPPRFIQVDIHICPSVESFSWHLFFQAHGDLWNMIGAILRRFGLTCNDRGLFLRIAEIEPHDRELSRVLLTKDPVRVLAYLGLDPHRYWRRFQSWDEMMAFAASCRFHDPLHYHKASSSMSSTNSVLRDHLKASDRHRLAKRPAFSYWIDTYLHSHSEDPIGHSAHLTREEVVDDAMAWFGETFKREFEECKAQGLRAIHVRKLWTDIRRSLPIEGREVGSVMQGLKREIGEASKKEDELEDHASGGDDDDGSLRATRRAFKEGHFEIVAEWALKNWKEVIERQGVFEREELEEDFEQRCSVKEQG
ncbi:hypothetical protein BGZ83_000607 [Gryganskiella cystojenkinii]|nr:hypothetical protein BGZ83_000607 [Gryganskiella cystojenkinii]